MKRKKPWLAALLNFVFPGLGYLYNGKRKIVSYIWITAIIVGIIGDFYYNPSSNTKERAPIIIAGMIGLFAFAYDAYNEAKSLNIVHKK